MRPIDADRLQKQIKDLELKCRKMLWSGGKLYEDCLRAVRKMIDDAPTIDLPPNDPLTLEHLREMDGEEDTNA